MTDRELLELAAKAAEYKLTEMNAGINGYFQIVEKDKKRVYGHHLPPWNPLTDDGDALRLAVKLGLLVDCDSVVLQGCQVEAVSGMSSHEDNYVHILEKYGNDPYAATRRAIVRAAAEIGRAMP